VIKREFPLAFREINKTVTFFSQGFTRPVTPAATECQGSTLLYIYSLSSVEVSESEFTPIQHACSCKLPAKNSFGIAQSKGLRYI